MIPDIGLMIGAYIITRMFSFLTRKGQMEESLVVKIFAIITMLLTFVVVIDLFTRGTSKSGF
jgi:hypothetical protein